MTPRTERQLGFTMVEVLVAAAITLVMAAFLAGIMRQVTATWRRAGGRLGADATARIILDQLQLDLQGALFRDDGNVWFAADVLCEPTGQPTGLWQPAPGIPKPAGGPSLHMTAPHLSDARFGTAGMWVRFFTTSRGNLPGSIPAPVAVGYQIIRRFTSTNPANAETAYLLHRAEVRPGAVAGGLRPGVLESGYDITSLAYAGAPAAHNSGAVTGDPLSILFPGHDGPGARNLDAVLGDNVIDFGVRCYVRDAGAAGGLRLVFPADDHAGTPSNNPRVRLVGHLPPSIRPTALNYDQVFPEVVDILIRILTPEGAARLAGIERTPAASLTIPAKYGHTAQEWWWGIAMEHSRVYSRRVVIPSSSG